MTASSLTNVAATSEQREVMEGRGLGNVIIIKFQVNVAEM